MEEKMTQTNAEILAKETDEIFTRAIELLHHSDPSVRSWVKRKFYDLEKVILELDKCETKKKEEILPNKD